MPTKKKTTKIEEKQKELNYLLVNDRENTRVEVLKKEIDYFMYGVI